MRGIRLWQAVLCLAAGFAVAAGGGKAEAKSCGSLAKLKLPDTTIVSAAEVAPGGFTPPASAGPMGPPGAPSPYAGLPAFCRVAGTIKPTSDSDIRFEVWMPAKGWNGKFVGVGNGVWAGSISYFEMVPALTRGYATAATDDGHQGSPVDASFAAGHPEKLVDFGHRAVHEMTVQAKAVIAAFYGKSAGRSLFASCSTGGRQGLMEAYRYPADYDAISATAPANPMTKLMIGSLWTGYAALKDEASRIPQTKFPVIYKAAVASCDAGDGTKDGIIGAPESCKFNPKVLQCTGKDASDCLTKGQVKALQAIYAGAKNPRTGEVIYPGFSPGSEMLLSFLTLGPEPFAVAMTYLRSVVFNDPKWDFKSFDYDADVARAVEVGGEAMDVPPEGVEAYLKGGGKLLLSHGWTDGVIPAMSTVNFYKALAAKLGDAPTKDSVRLFMVPGMDHCAGGDGPFVVDMLGAIDAWAESGKAPESLIASNPPGAAVQRTRPLCPYPKIAKHQGSGSSDEAAHFECTAPAAE